MGREEVITLGILDTLGTLSTLGTADTLGTLSTLDTEQLQFNIYGHDTDI